MTTRKLAYWLMIGIAMAFIPIAGAVLALLLVSPDGG
jgi:hypothetical protein